MVRQACRQRETNSGKEGGTEVARKGAREREAGRQRDNISTDEIMSA